MASQRIIIAKIAGEAGLATMARFRSWGGLRVFEDPDEWEPTQWPGSARGEMDSFGENLRTHSHEPPTVYFNEHVDLWMVSGDYERWLKPKDGPRAIEVHSDRFQLWCYSLPDDGALAEWLRRPAHNSPEERWFRDRLREAVQAWTPLVEVASIVVLREVLGGLVEDHDVQESMNLVPGWLAV